LFSFFDLSISVQEMKGKKEGGCVISLLLYLHLSFHLREEKKGGERKREGKEEGGNEDVPIVSYIFFPHHFVAIRGRGGDLGEKREEKKEGLEREKFLPVCKKGKKKERKGEGKNHASCLVPSAVLRPAATQR